MSFAFYLGGVMTGIPPRLDLQKLYVAWTIQACTGL